MEKFDSTVSYTVIYAYSIPDEKHKGLLKVGMTNLKTDLKPTELPPNCHAMNQAAIKRIAPGATTMGVKFNLEYTELARKSKDGEAFAFTDKSVHEVLLNAGIKQVFPDGVKGTEWFETDLATVKAAITAVKKWKDTLSSETPKAVVQKRKPIEFRQEQLDAIEKTIRVFKKENDVLWYAKMRFGKTLTALEVIRRMQYQRVIIATHRPVVDDGWSEDFGKVFFPGNSEHEYLYERKTKDSAYVFDEKTDAENDAKLRNLEKNGDYFIYFASIQDLRGSQLVGGKFNKNNAVFAMPWSAIIIDEGHEGTQTELGDNVIRLLRKKDTKVLALSGTPFNLLGNYTEDSIYTWDYVMEQRAKEEWDLYHFGDSNPYAKLPKMHIYTYDLGEKLRQYVTDEYGTKAFKFSEFFRVYYKGPNGKRELPNGAEEGRFVHEEDVKSFLNLLIKEGDDSGYPFSTQEYRDMFRHTLWMVPGIKEAKALSELLRKHPVFGKFGIANVAGDGDDYEETHQKDALEKVRATISKNDYSITLSCGKLTTGVTVPEWTAVLMLSGTFSTAASQYLQTIFRVQSPGDIDGKMKTDCFVFDFAPDRTLKVLTETVHLSRKPGRSEKKRRDAMVEFLNYCPVISVEGSKTQKYSVETMMEQLKQVYAERAVNRGFDDESLYNDELLKLDEIDASKFNALRDIIGTANQGKKPDRVVVNDQGLTDEQIEHLYDDKEEEKERKKKPELTPEQLAEKKKLDEARKARKKAIDILRGISVRMPLLIYGADVPVDEAIDIDRFVELVDEESWEEFMPQGVTKEVFNDFTKYYDRDVFIAAGKRIRRLAAEADNETPTRRVSRIAEIFRHFKNPDKETVLTPWRVVNLHLSDTIGGWCFYNENFEEDTDTEKRRLDEPRFVDHGEVTAAAFGETAKVLEINSKTGLYPLYVAYSCYKQRMEGMSDDDWEPKDCQEFWRETLAENIFVICKTKMAKAITLRTLRGYKNVPVNIHYFDDLVNMLKNKPEQFRAKVLKEKYWKKGEADMKFNSLVSNPPYMITDHGSKNSSTPIYNYFVEQAKKLQPDFMTMIMPARWYVGGKGLDAFRENMLNDKNIQAITDYADFREIFPTVDIAGGVCYFLWKNGYEGPQIVRNANKGTITEAERQLNEFEVLVRDNTAVPIIRKVLSMTEGTKMLSETVSPRKPFSLPTDYKPKEKGIPCHFTQKLGFRFADEKDVTDTFGYLSKWKFLIPRAPIAGQTDFTKPVGFYYDGNTRIAKPGECCTEMWLVANAFNTKEECESFKSYIMTKTVRFLLLQSVISQDVTRENFRFVPDLGEYRGTYTDKQLRELWKITDEEWKYIDSRIHNFETQEKYAQLRNATYNTIVATLLKKYGPAKHNYFKDTNCTQKNHLVSRTNEGLLCHHIDEDKAILLSNDTFAANNPFDYQKANRLVYCNLLEHLLLHVKIAEEPKHKDANPDEMQGIGGAVSFICHELNDIYAGKTFSYEWRTKVAEKVKDDFDEYIAILKRLWVVIEKNPLLHAVITKETICTGTDGKVVADVLEALD